MNGRLNSFLINLLMVFAAMGCSKSSDPVVVNSDAGCAFSFKGKSFIGDVVTCSVGHLSSSGGAGADAWVLTMEPGNGYISFQITNGPYENDSAVITIKNNTVSFDAPLENLSNDKGTFNGKCGCSSGSLQ